MINLKWTRILILVLCSLSVLGCGTTGYMLLTMQDEDNRIEVTVAPDASQHLEFRCRDLKPGQTVTYTVVLNTDIADMYDVALTYEEDDGALQRYVTTEITYLEESYLNVPLTEAFALEEPVMLTGSISKEVALEFNVSFTMPSEVGNEAQGLESVFDLVLVVSNT